MKVAKIILNKNEWEDCEKLLRENKNGKDKQEKGKLWEICKDIKKKKKLLVVK